MTKIATAETVYSVIKELESIGVVPILDGGWSVDALLHAETREHKDIDLIIQKKDLDVVKKYFLDKGFIDETEGNIWWHFFMTSADLDVDFLVIEFDDKGGAYLGPRERNAYFPPTAFSATGTINGLEVQCLTPEYKVMSLTRAFGVVVRNQYQITEKDCRDMIALCKKYSLPIPNDYSEFMSANNLKY